MTKYMPGMNSPTRKIVRIHVFTKIEKELAHVEPLVTVT